MRAARALVLVLTVVALPSVASAQALTTAQLQQIATQDALAAGIDPATFLAQIQAESGFNPNAINNSSGATGIAQFLPSTAANAGFGIAPFNPSDPVASLQAAAQYDAALAARDGSLTAALTDYSGGLTPSNPGAYAPVFAAAQAASGGTPLSTNGLGAGGDPASDPAAVTIGGEGGGTTIVDDQPGSSPGPGGAILDTIASQFLTATSGWQAALFNYAIGLFWLLALIEIIVSLILLVISGVGTFDNVIATIIRWLLPVGLFSWILLNASTFAADIINSLRQAGGAIGAYAITPTAIFAAGINTVTTIWNNYHGFWGTIEMIPVMIADIPIILAFVSAAVWMLMILIESYFVFGLAVLLVAFGGMRWSRHIAMNLLLACVAVGFKLLVIEALAPVATSIITQIAQSSAGLSFQGIFTVLGAGVAFAALAKIIPDRIERIVLGAAYSLAHPQQFRREAESTAAIAVGAGAAVTGSAALALQAIKHAIEQQIQNDPVQTGQNQGQGSRALQLTGAAAGALARAAGSEISGRLGGLYRGGIGASATRMASNVAQARRVFAAQQSRPQPPSNNNTQGGQP